MTVKKSVAGANKAPIPQTATEGGELEATSQVTGNPPEETVEQAVSPSADTVRASQVDGLAKARAAKAAKAAAAKALARKQEVLTRNEISGIQAALAAEAKADKHSFGEIKEVGRIVPTAEEYIRVEMPLKDLFDVMHPGVQLNRHKFEAGKTYLLRGDVALEVKRRLAMFHDEQVRLLRPNADRKALNDVNRGSQWTSRGGNAITPLGRLEDVPTASDEVILTVDF